MSEKDQNRSPAKRRIMVISVGRSDFGIYLPVLKAIDEEPAFQLQLVVAGDHEAGFPGQAVDRVELAVPEDSALGVARSMAQGLRGFAEMYERGRPDLLLVLGDRFEMFAAASAAVPFRIPLAHLHGGELTEGAMDEQFRHAITKLSHLHFASTQVYADRIMQMGEESWRVTVSGAPALDHLRTLDWMTLDALQASLDMNLDPPPLLATFHPATLEAQNPEEQIREFLGALEEIGRSVVFTHPNADPGHRAIAAALEAYVERHPACRCFKELGSRRYFSLMRYAAAMVGNSSSGIIEAASCKLPVVNVGSRQQGRVRAANVVDVDCVRRKMAAALQRVLEPSFRERLQALVNPYGDGHAAARIVKVLRETPLEMELIRKKFVDYAKGAAT